MTLREDLERAIEASKLYEVSGSEPTNLYEFQALAMDLLRDHGQALVEALRDAERYRWLRSCSINEVGYLFTTGGPSTDEDFDSAIDTDRKENA